MIEKMKVCVDDHEAEINTAEIAECIIAKLNDIISNDVCAVLTSMGKSDANEALSTTLCRIVKDNIKELM